MADEPSNEQLFKPGQFEPQYQCWYEKEFQADLYVARGMKPLERHFYRALLQSAYFHSTRPYLPADDQELAFLADAENIEDWLAHKPAVMKKFYEVTIEGVAYWAHKRLLADWARQLAAEAKRQEKWEAGKDKRSQASRNAANARWNRDVVGCDEDANRMESCDALRDDALNKTKLNQTETKQNETESKSNLNLNPNQIESGSGLGSGSRPVATDQAEELKTIWVDYRLECNKLVDNDYDAEPFQYLINSGVSAHDIKKIIAWLPCSNYWDKPGEGKLTDPDGFRKAYNAIHQAYRKYKNAKLERQAQVNGKNEADV